MSYEVKYVKYKLKYLKLLLSSELEQHGGTVIEWPRQTNDIKPGDKVKIVRFGTWKSQGNAGERSNLKEIVDITGKVKSVDENKLELSEINVDARLGLNGSPLILYSNNYPGGIVLSKIGNEFETLSSSLVSKFTVKVPGAGAGVGMQQKPPSTGIAKSPPPISASASDKQVQIVTQDNESKASAKQGLAALFGNRGIGAPQPAFLKKSIEASSEAKPSGDNSEIEQIKKEISQLEVRLEKLEKGTVIVMED